jgi:hypothetical protein
MYPIQHMAAVQADQAQRHRSRPVTGIRRSARLISLEIHRSREAGHRR